MRSLIVVLSVIAGLMLLQRPVQAGILDEVRLEFISGDVTGDVRGQGTATVSARITNIGDRNLNGVRIAAYYSPYDTFPDEFADWLLHEFLLEPPLRPGKSVVLQFQDPKAFEYIQLELRRANFDLRIVVNGEQLASEGLVRIEDGAAYMQSRDLVGIIGGELKYDAEADRVELRRGDRVLLYKDGRRSIDVNEERRALSHPVIQIEGRTWVPVESICRELEIECEIDHSLNVLTLTFEPLSEAG
ncbi:MAG: stalk domain-containing protein [bacterium]